nr:mucin-2-like [Danio rerio]|eukprot:XP_017209973.1 mucin-2-like [Danio rerio]
MYLVVNTDIGLTVLWDRKTTVSIILHSNYTGKVCGLCGNFNGDGKDDFTTKGGLQTSNIIEFVESWKQKTPCPDSAPDFDPCFKNPYRSAWAQIKCAIIKKLDGAFKDCHRKVDPSPYYDNCLKDTCACDTGGDCECLCTAVAAYAQACNEASVGVDWRTPEICRCFPECPDDKPFYDEKNNVCVPHCAFTTPTSTFTTTSTFSTTSITTTTPTSTFTTTHSHYYNYYDTIYNN